jgi:hypothetical protein
MPDEMIDIKDIYEKVIRIETRLDEVLAILHNDIIKEVPEIKQDETSPFYNPETKLYDMKYYRQQQDETEGKK